MACVSPDTCPSLIHAKFGMKSLTADAPLHLSRTPLPPPFFSLRKTSFSRETEGLHPCTSRDAHPTGGLCGFHVSSPLLPSSSIRGRCWLDGVAAGPDPGPLHSAGIPYTSWRRTCGKGDRGGRNTPPDCHSLTVHLLQYVAINEFRKAIIDRGTPDHVIPRCCHPFSAS